MDSLHSSIVPYGAVPDPVPIPLSPVWSSSSVATCSSSFLCERMGTGDIGRQSFEIPAKCWCFAGSLGEFFLRGRGAVGDLKHIDVYMYQYAKEVHVLMSHSWLWYLIIIFIQCQFSVCNLPIESVYTIMPDKLIYKEIIVLCISHFSTHPSLVMRDCFCFLMSTINKCTSQYSQTDVYLRGGSCVFWSTFIADNCNGGEGSGVSWRVDSWTAEL